MGRSSPYCGDIWRRYCCLTSYFPIVDACLSCEDIARQSCAMVARWRLFTSCIFSEPRAAHVRPAFEVRTKATPCVEIWQTSNLRPLILGEERKKERKKKEQTTGWKYIWSALLHRATINEHTTYRAFARSSSLSQFSQTSSSFFSDCFAMSGYFLLSLP